MHKGDQNLREFLERQLQWSKEQILILDAIDVKLHEMKEIVEYVLEYDFTPDDTEELNGQLNELQREVHSLQKQLHSVVH